MPRKAEDYLKDAGELARRTNLQVIVISAGLLLAWLVNLEDGFSRLQDQAEKLAKFDVRADNLDGIVERRQQRLKSAIDDIKERQEKEQKRQEDIRIRKGNPGSSVDASEPPPLAPIRQMARVQKLQDQIKAAAEIRQASTEAKQAASKTLSEKISFDVGQGIKLPFTFKLASLAWLMILALLLGRIIHQRAKFWGLVSEAVVAAEAQPESNLDGMLIDMPIWLAPIPRHAANASIGRRKLELIVNWRGTSTLRMIVCWLIAAAVIAIILRVCWIGLIANGIAILRLAENDIFMLGIMVSTALAIVLSIWLCIPPHALAPQSITVRDRRIFLGLTIGAGLVFAMRSRSALAYFENRHVAAREAARSGFRRNKPRRAFVHNLAGTDKAPGLYMHRRSGQLYSVDMSGKLRNGRAELNVANLIPTDLSGRKPREFAQSLRRNRSSSSSKSSGSLGPILAGVEEQALALVKASRYDDAVALLLRVCRARFLEVSPRRPIVMLKQLDLAAGIAIRYGQQGSLSELVRFAEEVRLEFVEQPKEAEQMARRIEQWTGTDDSHENWRRSRWRNQPRPLRWGGRILDA